MMKRLGLIEKIGVLSAGLQIISRIIWEIYAANHTNRMNFTSLSEISSGVGIGRIKSG